MFKNWGLTQSDTFISNSNIHSQFLALMSSSDSLTPHRASKVPTGLCHLSPHALPGPALMNSAASIKGPRSGSLVPWCWKRALWIPGGLQEPFNRPPRPEPFYNDDKTLFAFSTGLTYAQTVYRQLTRGWLNSRWPGAQGNSTHCPGGHCIPPLQALEGR